MNPQRLRNSLKHLKKEHITEYWNKFKFELKWRWEDIKHEHSAGIPNDPGEPEPPKIPLSAHPKIFYRALVDSYHEIKDDILYYVNMFKKNNQSWDEQVKATSSESMVIPRNNTQNNDTNNTQSETTGPVNSMQDFEKFQMKLQHIVKSRFILIQACVRQFMIGYNEGMGRDIESFTKKKELSDLLGTNQLFNKGQWMDQVKNVASGIKKFREEMHDIAVIKEDDQLLKEDLQKAELISQQDSKVLLNKQENPQQSNQEVNDQNKTPIKD